MTLEVFDKLRPYYTSELLQQEADDVVLVRMQIPEPNALSLVFIYHSRIRVIEPASLLHKVIDAMLEMQKTYLNQEIKTNSGGTT